MKPVTFAASLFATALTFAAAQPALAETADAGTCRTLGAQVGSALSNASGDMAAARSEQRAGSAACLAGFYANGASHYQKALSLIGK